ncbi:MAG: DUF4236 domain-containing protein [Acidobacteria bacterium]|nr:DUF4236 domain-containing protein [Acidobacteriota bacterium]
MGFYIRKSLGKVGPVRFNLSKSGIGMSTGVRGARIGVGPRGAYLAGGRGGLYHRQYLKTGSKRSSASRQVGTVEDPQPVQLEPAKTEPTSTTPKPGGYRIPITLGVISLLLLSGSSWPIGLILLAIAIWFGWRQRRKIAWCASHETLLSKLTATPDDALLADVRTSLSSSPFKLSQWQARHEQAYRDVFSDALSGGVDSDERRWLDALAGVLQIRDTKTIHVEALRALLWQLMADGEVTENEETFAEQVIGEAGLSREDLSEELAVMDEFVRARKVRQFGLPVVEAGISLQKGEVCHHATRGAFLDKKVLRSYTRDGQKHKEEGLVVDKEGDIYITSKRILIVADGMSGIPHQKVLDIEINQDEKLIEIIKDGRQKPVYIKVPDAVYSGMLIEMLSDAAG